jgi:lipase maturation factor 1
VASGVAEWWSSAESAAAHYSVGAWLFLRAIGLIYVIAFASLALQIDGLAGRQGILPAREFLAEVRRQFGRSRFRAVPTLCWLNDSDPFLRFLCWGGAAAGVLVLTGVATLPALMMCWVFYLSLFGVARLFLGYQWDVLLLETGFLAILLAPLRLLPTGPVDAPPWPILILLYWLLFRLMFLSGLAKLRSGDVTWRRFTALAHHYETQPLPTPPAWSAHQLPQSFHKLSALVMFVVELGVPFLIFAPPPYRYWAAFAFVGLMLLIMLTGNYCFFNLLAIALCFLLFDNSFYGQSLATTSTSWPGGLLVATAVVMLGLSMIRLLRLFRVDGPLVRVINRWLDAVPIVNPYGLFSVMTTSRMEIVVEGSRDGRTWEPYEFKWKPGDVTRAPPWVAPHQPRLDWQMWFAALGDYRQNGWFIGFLIRLLQGSPPVLALLRRNPFPDGPPSYVRAVLYQYRFTDRKTRRATGLRRAGGSDGWPHTEAPAPQAGAWWTREKRWLYCPVYSLRGPEREFMPGDDF